MTRNRLVATLVATAACAGAAAPAASADSFSFSVGPQGASVGAWRGDAYNQSVRLEVLRGGTVVADSAGAQGWQGGYVELGTLQAGDVANFFVNGTRSASVTYDGLPQIGADACVGSSAFTVTRTAGSHLEAAGAYAPGAGYGLNNRSTFTQANPGVVTLTRPLAAGDSAYAATSLDGANQVYSSRDVAVGACPTPPPPPAPPTTSSVPTDEQVQTAVKTAIAGTKKTLAKLDPAALAKRKAVALPFAFPEPGTARLEMTARKGKGKKARTVVIGAGTKKVVASGKANVSVKFTKAGRKLLKSTKKLKVTLSGTFTPARAGAKAQKSSTAVTLKRKKKH